MNKEDILALNFLCDNEYLDKYIFLVNQNKNNKRKKFKTQKHHIIPKSYYKIQGLPINDSSDNVVHLLYKDHVLAHYYLCLCVDESSDLYYKCLLAFQYLYTGQSTFIPNTDKLKNLEPILLDDITVQQLYETLNKMKSVTQKGKNRDALKKLTPEQRAKARETLRAKYASGELTAWNKGCAGKKHSDAWKAEASKRMQNRITVHKGDIELKIDKKQLTAYLEKGYKKGMTDEHYKKILERNQDISRRNKISKKLKNHKMSKQSIEKMRSKLRGRHYKQHCEKKKWVNDGLSEIKIVLSNVDAFLKAHPNYKLGRVVKPFKRKE